MLRRRLGFQHQLQLVVGLLVAGAAMLVMALTLRAAYQHSQAQLVNRLDTAEQVVQANIRSQTEFLNFALDTVAKDFSTKRLVGQVLADISDTNSLSLASAMENHQQRISAQTMAVLDSQGNVLWQNDPSDDFSQVQRVGLGRYQFFKQQGRLLLLQTIPMYFVERANEPNAWIVGALAFERVVPNQSSELLGAQLLIGRDDSQLVELGATGPIELIDFSQWSLTLNQLSDVSYQSNDYVAWKRFIDDGVGAQATAILLVPYEQAHLNFYSFAVQLFASIIIVAILVVIIVRLVAKAITKPIVQLVEISSAIQQGDYQAFSVSASNREIAALNDAFSSMQDSIQQREDQVNQLAFYDELTALSNRAGFKQRLIARIDQPEQLACVGLINLDRFSEVNDTIGHEQGDKLIQLVAKRLVSVMPENSELAHLSGDEYAFALAPSEHAPLITMVEQIAAAFKLPFNLEALTLDVSASIGIAYFPDHGKAYSQLMQHADNALNRCKQSHEDFFIYQASVHKYSLHRLSLMSQLKQAIEQDELALYVQPKYNIKTKQIDCAECLVRWIHPDLGFIPPDDFIGLAEQTGTIRQLTRWVVEHALISTKSLSNQGLACSLAVNISAIDLLDSSFATFLIDRLGHYQVDESLLTLEITESSVMADANKAIASLNLLNKMGIKLSIDDFGTGYSSLSQLKGMPVSELKIDKSFVFGAVTDKDDGAIVKTIVQLAKSLSLQIVAEGVESQEVIDYLTSLDVEYAQGYYIAKPMPIAELENWLLSFKELKSPE